MYIERKFDSRQSITYCVEQKFFVGNIEIFFPAIVTIIFINHILGDDDDDNMIVVY